MRRREFIVFLGSATVAWPLEAAVQQPVTKIPRTGILTSAETAQTPIFKASRQGLRELGYSDGRNIILEFRSARGDPAAFPGPVAVGLARERWHPQVERLGVDHCETPK